MAVLHVVLEVGVLFAGGPDVVLIVFCEGKLTHGVWTFERTSVGMDKGGRGPNPILSVGSEERGRHPGKRGEAGVMVGEMDE